MIHVIADALSPAQLAETRTIIDAAEWADGKATAGHQARTAKHNHQIPPEHPAARQAGAGIVKALSGNPRFLSAALPAHILPPMFNRYTGGEHFGTHVDGAIRPVPGTAHRLRADLSITVFLTPPEDYDGGELVVEDTYGTRGMKLPAGQAVLYPASSLHHVTPVTRGARVSSFFWIQSLVRDNGRRDILFDLDAAIQRVAQDHPGYAPAVQLTGVYHNLLRQWAEI